MNEHDDEIYDFSGLFHTEVYTSTGTFHRQQIDKVIDETSPTDHDGRRNNHTFFYVEEVENRSPSNIRKWYRLHRLQEGVGEKTRRQDNRRADRERWARTFCSQADLTKYQTTEVIYICDRIDFRGFAPGTTAEKTILGIMSLVCERDGRVLEEEPAFQGLLVDMELSEGALIGIRNKLREKIQAF